MESERDKVRGIARKVVRRETMEHLMPVLAQIALLDSTTGILKSITMLSYMKRSS